MRIAASAALIGFGGCATTATIGRTDAPDNEAEIVRSDEHGLLVRGSNGQVYRLDRASVSTIDHPGNVLMVVGGLLMGMVATVVLAGDARARRELVVPFTLIYGLPGAGLFAYGTHQYVTSTSAARAFTDVVGPELPLPPDKPDGPVRITPHVRDPEPPTTPSPAMPAIPARPPDEAPAAVPPT